MLVSENETLKTELSELKEQNIKLSNISEKAHEHSESNKSSDVKNILNEYEYNFQKFLTTSLNKSKMASMIYGVSRNNRSGIGYKPPSGKRFERPKSVDEMILKYTPLYSQFKYGHAHDLKYTRSGEIFKYAYQPKFQEKIRKTNKRGPKRIWVPKDIIIFVADVLSKNAKTPPLETGKWMQTSHKGKRVYIPKDAT